ncbi:hypothetical protein [Cohnella rhizosphaerae]|uniref:Uncharacterized protein n=1 Tax=Cohnella rhizosphaerae TaxID=1457232 RepID=A0A9X4KW49_9BACL|nr:hypothetical protein [Cohnella rhizosphaerae]MDG0812299.1 hypothetical protein [Cohnella rhizosphaerae]
MGEKIERAADIADDQRRQRHQHAERQTTPEHDFHATLTLSFFAGNPSSST